MRILPALLFALLPACGGVPNYDYKKEPDPRRSEFRIGVFDQLRVIVWKNPELSTDASVRPDGAITLPLLGDVRAAGLTPSQLKQAITERLAAFVRDEAATVTITVTVVNSYRFTVTGNVEHPGLLNSKFYVTVLEALTLAGGLNKFAGRAMLLVRTDDAGKVRRIPLDYERIASGQHPDENLVLLAGDTLVVP